MVVRTTGDPAALAPAIRAEIRALDADLAIADITPMTQLVVRSLTAPRFYTSLLALFAAIALTLAVVGLYSVTAYTVLQRTREIGIRMALGATRSRVMRLVVVDCSWMIAAGIALGLVAAAAATRSVESVVGSVAGPSGIAAAIIFAPGFPNFKACMILSLSGPVVARIPLATGPAAGMIDTHTLEYSLRPAPLSRRTPPARRMFCFQTPISNPAPSPIGPPQAPRSPVSRPSATTPRRVEMRPRSSREIIGSARLKTTMASPEIPATPAATVLPAP